MKSIIDLWRGIFRHPFRTLQYIFTPFSVIFTIIKMITHFVPGIKIEGLIPLTVAFLISVCFGLKKIWKPSKIEIKIA